MNTRVMREMHDAMHIVINMEAIDAFYGEDLEHPRIYVYVNGAKIVLDYKDKRTFKDDLSMIKYYVLEDYK